MHVTRVLIQRDALFSLAVVAREQPGYSARSLNPFSDMDSLYAPDRA